MSEINDLPCCFCERSTKYRCISCQKTSCNICSTGVNSTVNGYSEEEKRVGRCPDCSVVINKQPKKIQRSIFSAFGKNPPTLAKQSATNITTPQTKGKTNPKQHKQTTSTRTVTPATVEKWKAELAQHSVAEWLLYDIKDGKVKNMRCKFCTTYQSQIKTLPNYSNIFVVGTQNYKKSAVEDHATKSRQHLKAHSLYLKATGVSLDERATTLSAADSSNVVAGLAKMDEKDMQRTKKKFEVAYFVAKNRLPLTTYPELLKLERKHEVDIGIAYNTDRACGTFIDYMGKDMKQQLNADLAKAKFFSVLCDGSTDNAVVENEVIYALHFDPTPVNSNCVEVKVSFLSMTHLKHQHAVGVAAALAESYDDMVTLKSAIESEFQSIGIMPAKKLIGFTSDGASVNRGNKNSVKMVLREESEWLVFIWCIAHRLELALSDALKGTDFDIVDEMLLRTYYLYQKAPKKLTSDA
ncbi:E3 SUMO-protein ligase KIAA1586-like [Hydractinia symbiolongicarpus]|uniref:E3 SUMO-protein ligase KIAA1586-like n=1 Tax=Hydractinia symbiolongicarpus TaxID=13093 RepID=UPI00254A1B32|nr:E3 SUMO-protein ligase KIAA1586-like [Hydractinia symbiolongicarpus]